MYWRFYAIISYRGTERSRDIHKSVRFCMIKERKFQTYGEYNKWLIIARA